MSYRFDVVGLGMATLDVLIRLDQMPTWEGSAGFRSFRFDGGGPVGTAMVAAAKLGARAAFVGTSGSDEASDVKLCSFVEAGVDIGHLVRRPGPEDQVVVVFVDAESGERVFCGNRGDRYRPLVEADLDREYITQAPFLHLDLYHAKAAIIAAQWMHEAGGSVVLDLGKTNGSLSERAQRILPYVDVLIGGMGVSRAITGIPRVEDAADHLIELGIRHYVETLGEKGSYTVTPSERFHTPAFPVEVVDTTGAGDVFHGAYIVGLLHGWNLQRVAQFAAAVSAVKCTQLGGRAGIPTFKEALSFLNDRGIAFPQTRERVGEVPRILR
jgi:ribokinase